MFLGMGGPSVGFAGIMNDTSQSDNSTSLFGLSLDLGKDMSNKANFPQFLVCFLFLFR